MNDWMVDFMGMWGNLNASPVSLEFGNEMTTTKWIGMITSKIDNLLNIANSTLEQNKNYIDSKFNDFIDELAQLRNDLNSGNIIPDGSISIQKLNSDFYEQLQQIIIQRVANISKIVWFGINDDGYFYAVIPDSWNEINFDTNTDGRLVLSY